MKSFFEWVGVTLTTSFVIGAGAAVAMMLLELMFDPLCGG